MGYVVKHSTSNVNKTRRKGKVAIGVDSGGYSKTSVSGFYAGVPPVEGKHNFVRTAAGGNPNFYSLTDEELINFVNGLGERNLTTLTPSQGGWAGSYSVVDSDTRTFNLTTQQNNAATTSAWRTFYWDVSAYQGQTVAISADVEFVSETNCNWLNFTIGQGNTGQYPIHIAGSDAADRVSISSKPTTSVKMAWSGSINATGIVGFTFWINNVTTNGANSVTKVSNVQIEAQDHVTEYSNPDKVVLTSFEALQYLSDREDIMFTDNIATKNIVTDGLVLDLNSRIKSSFRDNLPTENSARVDTWQSIWNNSGTATWNSNDTNVPRFFPDITVHSMVKDTNGNSHLGVGYTTNISEGVECTYSLYVWIPSSNSAGMSGSPPYMRPQPANYNAVTLNYNGSTSWGSWPRDQWIRIEGTATPTSNANGGISTAYISSYLNTAGDVVYYTAPQFENKSSATPFVSGSRSQNTTWYDLSGYGNNFTSMNNMTFTSHSFDFNGVDSGVQNNISSYNPDGADSVLECLFKPMDLSGEQAIFSDNYGPEFGFWIHTNGKLRAIAYASVYADLEIGKWYHAIMNIDPGATKSSSDQTYVQLYLNGEYIGQSNANTGNGMNDQPFTLGYDYRSGSPTRYFSGSIAAASVYYGQFTQEEVSQNYYGGPIVTDGLTFAADAGNLVSYESGSTTAYSMTGSYSTSLVNGVGYSNNNGGAWIFDGVNDYINVSAFNVSYLTIDTWVYRTSTTTHQGISRKQNEWALSQYNGTLQIAIGPAWYFLNTGYTIPLNTWTHITYTYSGTNQIGSQIVYINGEEIFSATDGFGPISAGGSTYRIGYDDNGWFWGGKIANQKIYNRALSNAEVLQNYNAQKARFGL